MRFYLFTVILLFPPLTASILRAETPVKNRLAVLEFKAESGVEATAARTVTELFITGMVRTGSYTIVDRANLQKVLTEQSVQQSGCVDTECAVQIGQLVAANKILTGTLSRLGRKIFIHVRLIDVEKGLVELAAQSSATDIENLDQGVRDIIRQIASSGGHRQSDARLIHPHPDGPRGTSIRRERLPRSRLSTPEISPGMALIPGIGQFQKEHYFRGIFFLGGSLTLLQQYTTARGEYNQSRDRNGELLVPYLFATQTAGYTGLLLNYAYFSGIRNSLKSSSQTANTSLLALGALLFINYLDASFSSPPDNRDFSLNRRGTSNRRGRSDWMVYLFDTSAAGSQDPDKRMEIIIRSVF